MEFFRQMILLFVKVENWARICSDWEIFGNGKTSAKAQLIQARHRVFELNQHLIWKLILTKLRNLGQLSASMNEPHFRINININIYNNININVNVKITIAFQVGIIFPPLGSNHSILNNTSEFRTSQLVFIALFLQKEKIQYKTKIAKLHRHSKSMKLVCSRPFCWSGEVNHLFIAISIQVFWNIYIFSRNI